MQDKQPVCYNPASYRNCFLLRKVVHYALRSS
jgi:hypothetical protein